MLVLLSFSSASYALLLAVAAGISGHRELVPALVEAYQRDAKRQLSRFSYRQWCAATYTRHIPLLRSGFYQATAGGSAGTGVVVTSVHLAGWVYTLGYTTVAWRSGCL